MSGSLRLSRYIQITNPIYRIRSIFSLELGVYFKSLRLYLEVNEDYIRSLAQQYSRTNFTSIMDKSVK